MSRRLHLFLILMLSLSSCIKEKQTGADLAIGDLIPDFTVTMNDGTQISGSQLREGMSCVVFFTTVCPDCQKTLPHVQRIYDEYASAGVKFVLISREEGQGTIEEHWKAEGYTMPYSAQEDRHIYELFAGTRVPRIYMSEDGIIRAVFTDNPLPGYDDLKAVLDSI